MIDLHVGGSYELVNTLVGQGLPGHPPRCTLLELFEYQGQGVALAELLSYQQHIYRKGFESLRGKLISFVLLPQETSANIKRLILLLRGQDLVIKAAESLWVPGSNGASQREAQYVVNWAARLGTLWWTPEGQVTPRDEQLRRARLAINLYHQWRQKSVLPTWFLEARNAKVDP